MIVIDCCYILIHYCYLSYDLHLWRDDDDDDDDDDVSFEYDYSEIIVKISS